MFERRARAAPSRWRLSGTGTGSWRCNGLVHQPRLAHARKGEVDDAQLDKTDKLDARGLVLEHLEDLPEQTRQVVRQHLGLLDRPRNIVKGTTRNRQEPITTRFSASGGTVVPPARDSETGTFYGLLRPRSTSGLFNHFRHTETCFWTSSV